MLAALLIIVSGLASRAQEPPKGAKGSPPGSIEWLYGDSVLESAHNKSESQRKALKHANELRKREGV